MRRAPKLPTSTAVGEVVFDVSTSDWKRIESKYDHALSKKAKQQIIKATKHFLEFGAFEQNAEPLAFSKRRTQEINYAAGKLIQELKRPGEGDDTYVATRYRISENFRHPRLTGMQALIELDELLQQLSIACHRSLAEIDQDQDADEGFREGEAWDSWVRALTKIAKDCCLPTGAGKGASRNKRVLPPSPFVRLVIELQKCLPAKEQRYFHSAEALTQAISRARRGT